MTPETSPISGLFPQHSTSLGLIYDELNELKTKRKAQSHKCGGFNHPRDLSRSFFIASKFFRSIVFFFPASPSSAADCCSLAASSQGAASRLFLCFFLFNFLPSFVHRTRSRVREDKRLSIFLRRATVIIILAAAAAAASRSSSHIKQPKRVNNRFTQHGFRVMRCCFCLPSFTVVIMVAKPRVLS